MNETGYFAPDGYQHLLRKELKDITQEYGRLILAKGPLQKVYWVQNVWYNPKVYMFQSISDAACQLRNIQSFWSFYPYAFVRKGKLITSKLPYYSAKPINFPSKLPEAPLGSFLLLNEKTLLASSKCSSLRPLGEMIFSETKKPPSRAYLKLFEALTLQKMLPQKSDLCLEVGASPGSWTYVLQKLGCQVIAVDKALLDPKISPLPHVQFLKKDAFSLNPEDFPQVSWLLSDIVCYPEKLLAWVKAWLKVKPHLRCICTLKFQGARNYDIVREFEKIPNSYVTHLFHNKHELTWIKS